MRKEFNELETTKKKLYGRGIEHHIFPSKNNPNVLFKVGHKVILDQWVNSFLANPDVFPKIFRTGKMKSKDYYYVEIEKLDTKKFENDWRKLETALEDLGYIDTDNNESFTDIYFEDGSNSKIFIEIGEKLKKFSPNEYKFYIDLLTTIKNAEKTIKSVTGQDYLLDVHAYNFGYSSDGKLKCLDI